MNLYSKYFKKYKFPVVVVAFCIELEAICHLLMSNIINA